MFVNLNMLALLILMSVFVFIGMKRAENLGYQEYFPRCLKRFQEGGES